MNVANPAVYVVVPAYNEESVIGSVIRSIQPFACGIIVVDDCSTDMTGETAKQAGAAVLRHSMNLGQGAALQTGLEYALQMGADIIVTFDADGQHEPSDINLMVEALHGRSVDIALGSRFLGKAIGITSLRRFILKLATFYTRLETGLHLTDTHNGLRAITAAAARKIHIRQNRMAHASELIMQIARLKLRYVEVPTTIHYTEYSVQKGQRLSNGLYILCDLILGRM